MTFHGNCEVVAAIDLGTTHSGYAYSFRYAKDSVHVNSNWKCGFNSFKVPTAIFFDEKRNFIDFGYAAQDKHAEYIELHEERNNFYFEHFKMALHKNEKIYREMNLTAESGGTMKAITVFSSSIKFLKDHLIDTINSRNDGNQLSVEKIRWVLTVPAIWSNAAKQFMREAGEKAGIPSSNLVIALEPECASVFIKQFWKVTNDMHKPGTKYIVLDNGGGTVDSTVHEVLKDGKIKEIYAVSGGDWGSTKINKLFATEMESIFETNVVETFRKEFPSDWVEFMRRFEEKKLGMSHIKEGYVILQLPINFLETYKKIKGANLCDVVKGLDLRDGIKLHSRNKLKIPVPKLTDITKAVTNDILIHLRDLIWKKVSGINFIFMVGGFSNSAVLYNEVKHSCECAFPSVSVFQLTDPDLVVMKGAVLFGWAPEIISIRKSKKTYGFLITENFNPDKHPPHLKIFAEGRTKCDKVFDRLVSINQEVPFGMSITRIYRTLYANATIMKVKLYESSSNEVEYCDEKNVNFVGEMLLPMPDTKGGTDRKIKVHIKFGETEILIEAIDETSRTEVKAKFDFLARQSTN